MCQVHLCISYSVYYLNNVQFYRHPHNVWNVSNTGPEVKYQSCKATQNHNANSKNGIPFNFTNVTSRAYTCIIPPPKQSTTGFGFFSTVQLFQFSKNISCNQCNILLQATLPKPGSNSKRIDHKCKLYRLFQKLISTRRIAVNSICT